MAQRPGQGWLVASADSFPIRVAEICYADGACGRVVYEGRDEPAPIPLRADQEVRLVFENRPESISLNGKPRGADESVAPRWRRIRGNRFFTPTTTGNYRFLLRARIDNVLVYYRLHMTVSKAPRRQPLQP